MDNATHAIELTERDPVPAPTRSMVVVFSQRDNRYYVSVEPWEGRAGEFTELSLQDRQRIIETLGGQLPDQEPREPSVEIWTGKKYQGHRWEIEILKTEYFKHYAIKLGSDYRHGVDWMLRINGIVAGEDVPWSHSVSNQALLFTNLSDAMCHERALAMWLRKEENGKTETQ